MDWLVSFCEPCLTLLLGYPWFLATANAFLLVFAWLYLIFSMIANTLMSLILTLGFAELSQNLFGKFKDAAFNRVTIPVGMVIGILCLTGIPRVNAIHLYTRIAITCLRVAVLVMALIVTRNMGFSIVAVVCMSLGTAWWVSGLRTEINDFKLRRRGRQRSRPATA